MQQTSHNVRIYLFIDLLLESIIKIDMKIEPVFSYNVDTVNGAPATE